MQNRRSLYFMAIALCLTLGLAPFFPEPHLIGKWRWLLGGAKGMELMDWFDLAMHSAPFLLLLTLLLSDLKARLKAKGAEEQSPR